MRAAEVSAPGIAVRVELHEGDRSKVLVDGAQNRQENRVIATHAHTPSPGGEHGSKLLRDAFVRILNRKRVDG